MMSTEAQCSSAASGGWFLRDVRYEGEGVAVLSNPNAEVRGRTVVQCTDGTVTVTMYTPLKRLAGDNKQSEDAIGFEVVFGPAYTCDNLTVRTLDGVFTTSEPCPCWHTLTEGGDGFGLEFAPSVAQFSVTDAGQACYWVLPLLNFLSVFGQEEPQLGAHPLRVPSVQQMSRHADGRPAAHNVFGGRNRLILFMYGGRPGFIERLPDYGHTEKALEDGRISSALTSLMVGEVAGASVTYYEVVEWLPIDFIHLLGMATGSRTGAPWIEIRDTEGRLVHRMHALMGEPTFSRGHRPIRNDYRAGSISTLLTSAARSSMWCKPSTRIVPQYILRACAYHDATLEDRFVYLVRAFETLANEAGLQGEDLSASLPTALRQAQRQILSNASGSIRKLAAAARRAGDGGSACRLERIAARAASANQKDKDFALKLSGLLEMFGLPDADIMNAHYDQQGRSTSWTGDLGKLRGAALHEGLFRLNEHDLDEVWRVTRHLQDVLIRLFLTMIGYDGEYVPTTLKRVTPCRVDWVTAQTPAADLGY